MIALLLSLALAAPEAAAPAVGGNYEAHQMEMGGALELQPGGRFRYALDYGAVSEGAEGQWSLRGGTVRLTADPRPPAFDPGRSIAAFRDEPLARAGDTLVLQRYDRVIRFKRTEL